MTIDHRVVGRLLHDQIKIPGAILPEKSPPQVRANVPVALEGVEEGRLKIDQNQKKPADKDSQATAVLPLAARECFKWLLCPVQDDPKADRPVLEAFIVNTTSGNVSGELERVCKENELVITEWSPIHLRARLKNLQWKNFRSTVAVAAFWEDSLRYLYLPQLKSREVVASAVRIGAVSRDFFGTAYGEAGGKFDGFRFGASNVSVDDTLLLIEPEAARRYDLAQQKVIVSDPSGEDQLAASGGATVPPEGAREKPGKTGPTHPAKASSFLGTTDVPAATATMRLVQIADEIVSLLASDPNAAVRVTLEIAAEFPAGVSDVVRRAISENATSLGFKTKEWE